MLCYKKLFYYIPFLDGEFTIVKSMLQSYVAYA
jgi:hypothetical protein